MSTTSERLCGCRRGPSVEQGKWYGVRSYLHLFYEDCTGASLDEELEETPAGQASHGWTSVLWKVSVSAGTFLLLIGGAALATGSLLPPKLERIGEAEFMVLDQEAVEYNYALGICRVVGMVLCAIAAALMFTCLLSSRLNKMKPGGKIREEEASKEEQLSPILPQETPSGPWGNVVAEPPALSRASWVQHIQPKGEP